MTVSVVTAGVPRQQPRRRPDPALVELVRVISAEDWSPATAAARLRARASNPTALRRLRARVARAAMQRPAPTDARAFATLALALGEPVAGSTTSEPGGVR